MPKEALPQNIDTLKKQEVKLQNGLTKADFVSITFTPRMYAPRLERAIEATPNKVKSRYTGLKLRMEQTPLEAQLRVADIKTRINTNAIPIIESRLSATQEQIKELQVDNAQLIARYADYQEELSGAENYVRAMRERLEAGQVNTQALSDAQVYYQRVESRAADPEIARAKDVYMASLSEQTWEDKITPTVPPEKPKKEAEQLPIVTVDRSLSTVQLNEDEPVSLAKSEMVVFSKLAKEPNKSVITSRLRSVLKNAGIDRDIKPSDVVNEIRSKIEEDPDNPKLLASAGAKRGTRYALVVKSIKFVGQSERVRLSKEAWRVFEILLPDGQIVRIQGQRTADALNLLLSTNINNQAESEDLTQKLYGDTSSKSRAHVRGLISAVRKKLKPHNWVVIQSVPLEVRQFKKGVKKEDQKQPTGKYYLEKIQGDDRGGKGVTPPTAPIEPQSDISPIAWQPSLDVETQQESMPLRESHILSLNYILENPEGDAQRAVDALGQTKQGRPHTKHQAAFALKRANFRLFQRAASGVANDEELSLKAKIEAQVKENGVDARSKFKEVINNFFSTERQRVEDVIEALVKKETPEELPMESEIALLVTLYKHRKDIIEAHGLPQLSDEVVERVLRNFPDRLSFDAEQITDLRQSAYEKFANIVRSDRLEELYDSASDNGKELILHFMDIDPETQMEALREALLSPTEQGWEVQAGRVVSYWQELNGHDSKKVDLKTTTEERSNEAELATDKTDDVTPELTVQQPGFIERAKGIFSRKTHEPDTIRNLAIERRLPDIRSTVSELLTQIEPHLTSKARTLNVAQISKFFKVKARFITKVTQNGYVAPERGRDYHPVFKANEIALLIFLKRNNNGLSSAEVKELKQLISEEVAKRQSKEEDSK